MIRPEDKSAAEYLLSLGAEERREAEKRINQLVRAQLPPDETKPAPPVVTLGDFLKREIETPPFLVSSGQLVRGEITVTVARAGKGKTTLGMSRLIRWSAGRPLFDGLKHSQVPEKPLKILMIENEGVASFMQEKLAILVDRGAGLTEEEKERSRQNMLIWGDAGYSNFKIDREADLELLKRAAEEHQPDAVLMEPFRGIWRGEENDATAMEEVLDSLVSFGSENGCAIMLTHHERKSGAGEDGEDMSRARGSGDLEGKVAVMEHYRAVKGGLYRELSWSKSRYAIKQPPVRMLFDHHNWSFELVADDQIKSAVLRLMTEDPAGWFWIKELAEELDETERNVRDALTELAEEGRAVKKKGTPERPGYRFRLKTDEASEGSGGLAIA